MGVERTWDKSPRAHASQGSSLAAPTTVAARVAQFGGRGSLRGVKISDVISTGRLLTLSGKSVKEIAASDRQAAADRHNGSTHVVQRMQSMPAFPQVQDVLDAPKMPAGISEIKSPGAWRPSRRPGVPDLANKTAVSSPPTAVSSPESNTSPGSDMDLCHGNQVSDKCQGFKFDCEPDPGPVASFRHEVWSAATPPPPRKKSIGEVTPPSPRKKSIGDAIIVGVASKDMMEQFEESMKQLKRSYNSESNVRELEIDKLHMKLDEQQNVLRQVIDVLDMATGGMVKHANKENSESRTCSNSGAETLDDKIAKLRNRLAESKRNDVHHDFGLPIPSRAAQEEKLQTLRAADPFGPAKKAQDDNMKIYGGASGDNAMDASTMDMSSLQNAIAEMSVSLEVECEMMRISLSELEGRVTENMGAVRERNEEVVSRVKISEAQGNRKHAQITAEVDMLWQACQAWLHQDPKNLRMPISGCPSSTSSKGAGAAGTSAAGASSTDSDPETDTESPAGTFRAYDGTS